MLELDTKVHTSRDVCVSLPDEDSVVVCWIAAGAVAIESACSGYTAA